MPQKAFDRTRETFSTTGTGTLTLAGAVTGFRTFSSVLVNAETCAYAAEDTATGDWEVGIGTYSANTLARTTILASSNGGLAVSWAVGTKQVWITIPADGLNAMPVGNREPSTIAGTTGTFSGVVTLTGSYLAIPSGQRLYVDGGGDTFLTESAANVFDVYAGGVNWLRGVSTGASITGTLSSTSNMYVNDSSNANMTIGLTLNQGAADDEILALKSSDVAHGITTITEADTFARMRKSVGAGGGLLMDTLILGNTQSFYVRAITDTTDATRSIAALGVITLQASLKSGTGITSVGLDKNLLVVTDNTTTRFILDSDGDSHQDVGTAWTNFDDHDDIALLTDLSVAVSRENDFIKKNFRGFLKYNRKALERAKLVTFNRDGHHFVNMSKLTMAHTGAIRQLGQLKADRNEVNKLVATLQKKVEWLERKLLSR